MECWTAIIADKDTASRDMIARLLSPMRYDVLTISDPEQIAATVSSRHRTLVLAELSLPGLAPTALCHEINQGPGFSYVVFMLERYERKLVTAAFEAGADDAIAKPLIKAELQARLQHAGRVLALEDARAHLENEGVLLAEISSRTNFHSRNYFEIQLENEFTRAHRFSRSLALILAEINHVPVNERVMRAIGHFLSDRFRANVDWAARHDEHQFAFVLPETGLYGALCATRRLHAELSNERLLTSTGLPTKLSVSFGVSAADPARLSRPSPSDAQTLLEAAEAYLRHADRQGRGGIAAGPAPHC